ncbi:MAG: hypothetical protein HN981_01445 [Candidatus Pacebacteria bacterium]|nr:hypothetical protein [Candidatus Paceibacterota bacterium]MBT4652670.1 hypothetical protein [Candidatus Paceibacterota bacterium]MBT6755827.1 hypothetical protein [Candidatus Paceibacterota bacterium]MBT6921040.1 hypothetical protein [Candidatus Paceibacterota bacterium]
MSKIFFDRSPGKPTDRELLAAFGGRGRDARLKTRANVRSMEKSRQAQESVESLPGYKKVHLYADPRLVDQVLNTLEENFAAMESARLSKAKAQLTWEAARRVAKKAEEAGITPAELSAAANSEKPNRLFSKFASIIEKIGDTLEPKLVYKLAAPILTFAFILSACGGEATATEEPDVKPGVTIVAEVPPTAVKPPTEKAPAPAIATSIPMSDVNLTYSSQYSGYELEAQVFVANNWPASLSGEALGQFGSVALISNYEVADISNNPRGLILKIIGEGWPEGTHVMESPFKPGELLFMTTSYASEQLGVEVASFEIGADGKPVAVDSNGNVVGYIKYNEDGTTSYILGGKDKAPNAVVIEKDYFEMSIEQRWEHTASFTNEINNGFTGLLEIIPDPDVVLNTNPTDPSVYWNPTTNKWEYENEGNTNQLDKTGESFGGMVADTIETDDGNFIIKDPETGVEMTFPGTVFLPGFGEISLKEIAAMNNEEFGTKLVDALIEKAPAESNPIFLSRTDSVKDDSVFLPGFVVGTPEEDYPLAGGLKPGVNRSESDIAFYQIDSNDFYNLTFSPETGEVMFSVKTKQVNPISTLNITYSPDGSTDFQTKSYGTTDNFGMNGKDEFAVLIEHHVPIVSHNEGGGVPVLQGNQGIFGPEEFLTMFSFSSEQEIIDFAKQYKLAVSYAFRIASPKR